MNASTVSPTFLWMLTIGLLLSISVGMFGEADAARTSKFRYNKPDAWNWVAYCEKKYKKCISGHAVLVEPVHVRRDAKNHVTLIRHINRRGSV